jgi:hypothetical protein
VHTGKLTEHAGKLTVHTGKLTVHTGKVTVHTGKLTVHTGNVTVHTGTGGKPRHSPKTSVIRFGCSAPKKGRLQKPNLMIKLASNLIIVRAILLTFSSHEIIGNMLN